MSVKVRERPKGSKVYWLFIDHAGRRKAKRVGDKKAAELAATKIRAKLAEGDTTVFNPPAAPVPTFGQYAEHWLTSVAGIRCQLSTLEQYRYRLRARLLPHLKDLPLTAITRDRIKTLVAQEFKAGNRVTEGRPISPETVRAFMATLTEILNSAVDMGSSRATPRCDGARSCGTSRQRSTRSRCSPRRS